MNKIEKLIQDYCPEGVLYRELKEVAYIGTGSTNGNEATENGKYPLFVRSKTVKMIDTYEFDEEAIIIPGEGGIGEIFHYVNGKYALHQRAYRISLFTEKILTKFIYYYMMANFKKFILQKAVNATVSSIRKPMIEKFTIPIIPLPVQQEIVNILDKFTQLEEELNAELEARRKQYEFYRNMLLTFNDLRGGGKRLKVREIAEIGTGSNNTIDAVENGKYPFYVRSQDVKRIDRYEFDEESLLTSGDGVGVGKILHYVNGKYGLHQRAYRIHVIDNGVSTKYMFYYMQAFFEKYIVGNAVNSSVTSVRRRMLEKFTVSIPPLSEQERIVSILDKFDALVNDSKISIQAEIEARRKQYAYYRNKLLTFGEYA